MQLIPSKMYFMIRSCSSANRSIISVKGKSASSFIFAILMIFTMVFSLTAYGSANSNEISGTQTSEAQNTSEENVTPAEPEKESAGNSAASEETSDTAGVSAEEKPDVSGASEDRPDAPGVSEDRSEDTLDSSEIPANGADDQPPEDITADDQSPVEQA